MFEFLRSYLTNVFNNIYRGALLEVGRKLTNMLHSKYLTM